MASQDGERVDPATVAAWYREHGGPLRSFLLGVVRDAELADELVQVTFTRAVEAGHTARTDTIKGWLFRVAYNEAMLVGRKRQVQDRSLRRLAEQPPRQADVPEEIVSLEESIHEVRDALDQLPVEQQAVVRMRIYEDKTFAVIAEELGAPLGTVLTRMRLALARLQRFLSDEAGKEE